MYVYIRSESQLWTVGFYGPDGWHPESDHASAEKAAERVHYLNGGRGRTEEPDPALAEYGHIKAQHAG